MACAAANAALNYIEKMMCWIAVLRRGHTLKRVGINSKDYPSVIAEIRGRGMMIGIELTKKAPVEC